MKKIVTAIVSILFTTTAFACWFTEIDFNATYIASVNWKAIHYSSTGDVVYHNGQSVDLPMTVQIKITEKTVNQLVENNSRHIAKAKVILQYKVIRQNGTSTSFITVKTIENPTWRMNFSTPVNLFGQDGVINIPKGQISANDDIIIRIWISDGTYYTGEIAADISVNQVPDTQSYSSGNIVIGEDGWKAPHVFRVKFSGKRRTMI